MMGGESAAAILVLVVGSQGGTLTETEPGSGVQTDEELARPWQVVVHDDPITLMTYVTHVFMKVFGYPFARAEGLMLEVHTRGRAIVWTGDRERAESYVLILHGYHLLATLDPVSG
jgi:ATP-dependent Clp protease adaptor protein ClpS